MEASYRSFGSKSVCDLYVFQDRDGGVGPETIQEKGCDIRD